MDLIPRSCHFPPDVKHTVQVLNIESLRKGDLKTGVLMSNCGRQEHLTDKYVNDKKIPKNHSANIRDVLSCLTCTDKLAIISSYNETRTSYSALMPLWPFYHCLFICSDSCPSLS